MPWYDAMLLRGLLAWNSQTNPTRPDWSISETRAARLQLKHLRGIGAEWLVVNCKTSRSLPIEQ